MWNILGIEPTTDIKAIKAAYARLAKQYNPEEHPEEFKRIFDAYKSACAYARSANKHSAQQSSAAEGLNLSFSQERSETDTEQDTPQENSFDFSNINENAKSRPKQKVETEDTLDFSSVGEAHAAQEEAEDEADSFDFSTLDPEKLNQTEEERLEARRRFYLEKIRRIVQKKSTANNYQLWYELLNSTDFPQLASDGEFRLEASMLLHQTPYTKEVANLIAYCFGNGATYICINSISDEWQVRLMESGRSRRTRTQHFGTSDMPRWIGVAVVIIAVLLFIVWPLVYFFLDSSSGSVHIPAETHQAPDPDNYMADTFVDAVNSNAFDLETLYPMCVGMWKNEQGYIVIDDIFGYALVYNGESAAGSISAAPAEKGASVYAKLSSDNEAYNGTMLRFILISKEGKSLTIIFPDGSTAVMYKEEKGAEVSEKEPEKAETETSVPEDTGTSISFDKDGFKITVTSYTDKPYTEIELLNTSNDPMLSAPKVLYENHFFEDCSEAMLYYPSGMAEKVMINNGVPDTQNNEVYLPVLWEDTDKYKQDDIISLRRVEPGEKMKARCFKE